MYVLRNAPALNCQILHTAALLLLAAMQSPAQPTVTFTTFPGPGMGVASATAGHDGALWIATDDRIVRMTTAGALTRYLPPFIEIDRSSAYDITSGPDGALWFTVVAETGKSRIGRITTDGTVTQYTLPGIDYYPVRITAGPDGALWFTENFHGDGTIGRITTAGTISEYEMSPCVSPNSYPRCVHQPDYIVAGPDAALWFNDLGNWRIHRITTTGVITGYDVGSNVVPGAIALGPDGALWFSGAANEAEFIGRITVNGIVTTYPLQVISAFSDFCRPRRKVAGPDGALWFGCATASLIGRVSMDGLVTTYPLPIGGLATDIALGPDGALWVVYPQTIVRAAVAAPVPESRISNAPTVQFSPSFAVQWSKLNTGGPDIQNYTIYVSEDGGAFNPWLSQTAATQATFTGRSGHTYGFYSISQDAAGKREPPKSMPEWTIYVDAAKPVSRASSPSAASSPNFLVQWSGTDAGGPGIRNYNVYVANLTLGGGYTLWLSNTKATQGWFPGYLGTKYGFLTEATDTYGNQEVFKSGADTITQTPGVLPADVNGDGQINCLDLHAVKAALGTHDGPLVWNPADVNRDGVVDVRDFALVSQMTIPGTKCD